MGNHYHLVLHTRRANLSMLMRHINGIYTQTYNRRHRKGGHLFQGRFKAILVDQDAYLLEVCRYVDLNPVRAHMVPHPADWPWSSYRAHVGSQLPQAWLDTPSVHGYLLGRDVATGRDAKRAALHYEKLIEQGKDVRLWDASLKQQMFLGDDTFILRMQTLLEPDRACAAEVPRTQRRGRPDSIQASLKTCERDEAIVRACREGGHSLSAIEREVELSVSRVSRIIAATKYEYQPGLAQTKN
ncbi:MAG: transposase [Hydrogenophilales bacterium RIFOXYD1_FULL_62_11]|nr:MAG: transposase [Hydrogenophilales bacterium RIFOXYD1_FULL_62_11]